MNKIILSIHHTCNALSSDNPYSYTMFFLGAGASVDAGFVDVVKLKDEFLIWLENESKTDVLSISNDYES
jgi:hypothetical protein